MGYWPFSGIVPEARPGPGRSPGHKDPYYLFHSHAIRWVQPPHSRRATQDPFPEGMEAQEGPPPYSPGK